MSKCDWVYQPPKGMGIHRTPIECPICGKKLLIFKGVTVHAD